VPAPDAGAAAGLATAPRAPLQTFTIVTCAAAPALAGLHDRMPVVVPPHDFAAWLDPARDPAALLVPYAGPLRIDAAS